MFHNNLSCRTNLPRVCYFCNIVSDSAYSNSVLKFLKVIIHSMLTNFSIVETSTFFGQFFLFCWNKFHELRTHVGGLREGLSYSPTHGGRRWIAASLSCIILLTHFSTIF